MRPIGVISVVDVGVLQTGIGLPSGSVSALQRLRSAAAARAHRRRPLAAAGMPRDWRTWAQHPGPRQGSVRA